MIEFEFDPVKSAAKLTKHGIDFTAAQAIWRDTHRIEVPARTTDEPRWMVIGQAVGQCWSAVSPTETNTSASSRSAAPGKVR